MMIYDDTQLLPPAKAASISIADNAWNVPITVDTGSKYVLKFVSEKDDLLILYLEVKLHECRLVFFFAQRQKKCNLTVQ